MDAICDTCGKPISGTGLTRRFCSGRCRQISMASPSEEEVKDPNLLLVRFFFALMEEMMSGPVTAEMIDEANRLRDSWQKDLNHLRQKIIAERERQKNVAKEREARQKQEAEARARRAQRERQNAPTLYGDVEVAFRILQLPITATIEEVHRSFRHLALQYHPDKNLDDPTAEEKFKRFNQAYRLVLSYLKVKASYAAR